ncbi:MAG: hypothetical protein HFI31_05700 [Lachnospiraceae bacterium]|jgi:tetratricopeptide (TPR) repeat protein|nr:hypothetical protein [Lachnospiraceae bacterium]MCI8994745.1 hypothetical protein [Lachnospiraceae bacterium]MCI9133668.1 hypothetical protein [Lachnospiraceae bacterium]
MCAVIICRRKRAEAPYEIASMGIHLYSLEELAYFLYENVYMVDRKMLGQRLYQWIAEEIGDQELAHKLEKGSESGIGIPNLILTILREVDYYSREELNILSERMKKLATYQEQERLKLRADEYFVNGNYQAAIYEYQKILDIRQSDRLGVEFYAHVWNNLGVCYCRLFLFYKASKAFRTSYQYQKNPETLASYVYSLRFCLPEEDFEEAMELQNIRGEQLASILERLERLESEAGEHIRVDADPGESLYALQQEYHRNVRFS